ncbi:MAG: hypothetical protein U0936_06445 [Planctomycetaceae bacterium]
MTRWSIILVLLPLLNWPANKVCADEDSLFQQIGRMIGGAIRGEAEPVMPVRVMPVNEAMIKPGEQDQQDFQKRIQAYSDAVEAWVIATCEVTEEQKGRLKEIFVAQVKKDIEAFGKGQDPDQRNKPFPKTFVLLFTCGDGIATEFSVEVFIALRKELLSPEQTTKLDAALTERQMFQRDAYINFLVSMVDKELYLSAEQRDSLRAHLQGRKRSIRHPMYSFQPQNYYLPYESLSTLLSSVPGKNILSTPQKRRLTDLTGTDPNNQHVVFQAADGLEGWYKQMHQLGLKQRDLYLRAAAVRIEWYQKELQLSPEQVDHLTIASKGAAIRALADWKENTEQTFEQMQQHMAQAGGNFGFGASLIDTRTIDNNEIWSEALKTMTEGTSNGGMIDRTATLKASAGASLLALFDEELWLTPDQRKALVSQFEKSVPETDQSIQYQDYIREIVLMAHPLFLTNEKKRNEVLTPPQQEVWKVMQSFFNYQNQNNYVQIQLRNNNGNFGFQIGQ